MSIKNVLEHLPRRNPLSLSINKGNTAAVPVKIFELAVTCGVNTADDAAVNEDVALDFLSSIRTASPDCRVLSSRLAYAASY